VIVVKNFISPSLPGLYVCFSHLKKFGEHLCYIVCIFSVWVVAGLCVALFQHFGML
jgi:hypothetical protein